MRIFMGARGPLPKRAKSAKTANGKRLRALPSDADAIFRRLVRDVDGVTVADVALLEDTARWVAVAKEAYTRLRTGVDAVEEADAERIEGEAVAMALTVTDTAHGNTREGRKNPLLIVLRTASEQIRANAQQLGATPLARARLPEPERERESIADVLFARVKDMRAEQQGSNGG